MAKAQFSLAVVADLQAQYNALEPGQRKLARKSGRRFIKEEGSIAKAIDTLTNSFVLQETRSVPLVVALTRAQAREEAFKYISRRWSAPAPPAGWGAAFPSVPGPPGNGLKRFGGRQHDHNILSVYACPVQPGFWHLGHQKGKTQKQKELRPSVELTRTKVEEGRDNQPQIRDEQSNVAEQESLQGGFLNETVMENLDSLNETSQFDYWIPDFDDDPEINGNCNESQPCRGDEYCDDGYDNLEPIRPPSRIYAHLHLWWYPVRGIVRRFLCSRFSWFKQEQADVVEQEDSNIPF